MFEFYITSKKTILKLWDYIPILEITKGYEPLLDIIYH